MLSTRFCLDTLYRSFHSIQGVLRFVGNFSSHGRPLSAEQDVLRFAEGIEGQGYSASDPKVIADEAAKLAMRADASIGFLHLQQVAAEKVPPSIPRELEEAHQSFVGTG
jgi:hypothetical protein